MFEILLKSTNQYIIFIISILIALTIHEISHGYTAYFLGDNTSKKEGRLSFNPIKHIDFLGFFSMILFGFGWAKPIVMNPYNFKNFKDGIAITAFLGPFSNFLLGLISFFIIKIFVLFNISMSNLTNILIIFGLVNFMLASLNILPIPLLDGFKIIIRLFSDSMYEKSFEIEKKYGIIILLFFVFSGLLKQIWFPLYNFMIIIAGKITCLDYNLIYKIIN